MRSASEARLPAGDSAAASGRVELEIAMATDRGLLRGDRPNQDAIGSVTDLTPAPERLDSRGRLFVLADGMGGAAGGREASRMAVDLLLKLYYAEGVDDSAAALVQTIHQVNHLIHARGHAEPELAGLGTTLVAALVVGDRLLLAHVGDSRAYLMRDGSLQRLTNDHSWVAEQIQYGLLSVEEARHHPHRNVLTRNLGSDPQTRPDATSLLLRQGDRILLCSDGLWGVLDEEQIVESLTDAPVEEAVADLVARANEAGGPDNISAVLLLVTHHVPRTRHSNTAEAITEPMPVIDPQAIPSASRARNRRLLILVAALLLFTLLALASLSLLRPPAPDASGPAPLVASLSIPRPYHWASTPPPPSSLSPPIRWLHEAI